MELSRTRGWDWPVLGQAPLPSEPVRVGKWLLVPAQDDSSTIPARTLTRIQAIYAAGLRPRGFVLVHEAPLELTAPAGTQSERLPQLSPALRDALTRAGQKVIEVAPGVFVAVAKAAATALAVGAAIVIGGPNFL